MLDFGSRRPDAGPDLPPLLLDSLDSRGNSYSLVTRLHAVIGRLKELARHRQPLRLHLYKGDAMAGVFESSIQRVDHDNGHMILHQLSPYSWRDLVGTGKPVSVSACLPSGHVVFDSHLAPLEQGQQNPFCRLDFPERMHVQQLRGAYRVLMLPNSGRVELQIGRELYSGKCLDLSLEGCCAQFPVTLTEAFSATTMPATGWPVRFVYDGREIFAARARVRRTRQDVAGLVTVGFNFVEPDPVRTRSLQPLLVALQRERIRQQPLVDL